MKTIREKAKENVQELSYETLHDWAVSEHTSRTHRWVEVHPDGDVSETEEADNNTTHWVDYPNKEVASIYEISAESCEPCNCDICCLYQDYEDGDKEEFLCGHSEEDWEYCQENTLEQALRDNDSLKSASDIRDEMLDNIDEIYYGYFDDETVKKMTWEEYNSSEQNAYLDEENSADQDVVFSNDTYIIRMFKAISHDNDHYFTGEDEDFAIVESKDGSFDSYLLYGCTLSDAIYYIKAASD